MLNTTANAQIKAARKDLQDTTRLRMDKLLFIAEQKGWLCGFAYAVGNLIRCSGDELGLMLLRESGLGLNDLVDGGAQAYDLQPIRAALRREGAAHGK